MQPDLFDDEPHRHARKLDPVTSHAAAEQLDHAAAHCALVLVTLDRLGSATFSEIASASGLTEAQVWRRLSDLQRQGYARPTGNTRPGKSKREQRIWRCT